MNVISLDVARNRLAVIWLGGGSVVLLIVVVQSLLHHYIDSSGDFTQEAWGWLLPTILPTLAMIIGVLSYTALDPKTSKFVVRSNFLTIAVFLSCLYLVLVLLPILFQPLSGRTASDAIGMMRISNLWLGPVQGLVGSALGALFVSKERKQP